MTVELPTRVRAALIDATGGDDDARELAEQAIGAVRYALDRALAHHANPQQFPLAAEDSLERRFLARVRRMPATSAAELADRARGRLAPAPAGADDATLGANAARRRATYGFVGEHEPTRPEAVRRAVRTVQVPAALRTRAERVARPPQAPPGPTPPRRAGDGARPGARRAATVRTHPGATVADVRTDVHPNLPDLDPIEPIEFQVPTAVRLMITGVHAVNTTEVRDEIQFGAVATSLLAGQFLTVSPRNLGTFHRGAEQSTAVEVCRLELLPGMNIDQPVSINFFLGERDRKGGFAEHVEAMSHFVGEDIAEAITSVVVAAIAALGADVVGDSIQGAVSALGTLTDVGKALGIGLLITNPGLLLGVAAAAVCVAGLLFLADYVLVRMPNDEVFNDHFVSQSVRPTGGVTEDRTFTRTFTHNRPDATYHISFAWEVVREPGPLPAPQPEPFGALEEIPEETARTNLDKIDHIVVLMLENRSFDHVLGYLRAREGRVDVDGLIGDEINHWRNDPDRDPGEDPVEIEVRPLTDTVFDLDPPHSFGAVRGQIEPPGSPKMDGFVDIYTQNTDRFREELGHRPHDVMGFHTADQVPLYDFIAGQFAICDKWFSSFPGNTWINRTIALCGEPARDDNGKIFINNQMPLTNDMNARSFFRKIDEFNDTLQPDEQPVDWRCYAQDFSSAFIIDPEVATADRVRTMDQFLADLASGDLPHVSWLDPNYVDLGPLLDIERSDDGLRFPGNSNDDHPPTDLAHGQAMIAILLFTIMHSPAWEKTLFVITYDEHGGMYDHVPPETPEGHVPEGELTDLFVTPGGSVPDVNPLATYGVRVPALVVSPWVEAGAVSKIPFDHTSLIKTILTRFCSRDGQAPFVSPRVERANHLGHVLTGDQPRFVTQGRRRGERQARPGVPGARRPQSDDSPPRALPQELTDTLLSRLGRRLLVAGARPSQRRAPTDLEEDIATARASVDAGSTPRPPHTPMRPARHAMPAESVRPR